MSNNIRNQPMYCQSGNFETENVAVDAYPGTLGSRVTVNTPTGATGKAGVGGKTYQRVLTDSGMAVAPFSGAVAWWADKRKSMVTTDPTKLGRGRVAGIFRKRLSPQVEAAVHAIGFLVLLGLIVIISISDIRRVVGG